MFKTTIFPFIYALVLAILIIGLDSSLDVKAKDIQTDSMMDNFDTFNETVWHKAHEWGNGDMFNATWYDTQVIFENGTMRLSIDHEEDSEANPPYKAGEYRSNQFFHYGLYEVRMKPAKGEGTVSSFFTYTGPYPDGDPWDEIDIEFLGKDTTKVQFNYFTDGAGNHEHYHELGFDASESFNTYAFAWRPDSIRWYVNGELVHTATENIPQTPQQIMMNLWPGIGVDEWTGVFNEEILPVHSYYDFVKYTPLTDEEEPDEDQDNEEDNTTPPDDEDTDQDTKPNDENDQDMTEDEENDNDHTEGNGSDNTTPDQNKENTEGKPAKEEKAPKNHQSGNNEGSKQTADNGDSEDNAPSVLDKKLSEGDTANNDRQEKQDSPQRLNQETDTKENNETSSLVVHGSKDAIVSSEKRLPNTATPLYNSLLAGLLLVGTGAFLYFRKTRLTQK